MAEERKLAGIGAEKIRGRIRRLKEAVLIKIRRARFLATAYQKAAVPASSTCGAPPAGESIAIFSRKPSLNIFILGTWAANAASGKGGGVSGAQTLPTPPYFTTPSGRGGVTCTTTYEPYVVADGENKAMDVFIKGEAVSAKESITAVTKGFSFRRAAQHFAMRIFSYAARDVTAALKTAALTLDTRYTARAIAKGLPGDGCAVRYEKGGNEGGRTAKGNFPFPAAGVLTTGAGEAAKGAAEREGRFSAPVQNEGACHKVNSKPQENFLGGTGVFPLADGKENTAASFRQNISHRTPSTGAGESGGEGHFFCRARTAASRKGT